MRMKTAFKTMFCAIIIAVAGCTAAEPDEPVAEVEATVAESFVCDPRNCVAFCATCLYRACRESGEDPEICEDERDVCIEECNQPQE
jgi:hypothetical protein